MEAASVTPPDWRVLPFERDLPDKLLDRSVALLDALGDEPVPMLRWYIPSVTGIVLGRGQGRLEVAEQDGIGIHMRSSGGGAVLLDTATLSLDVLVPAGHPWLSDDLGALFDLVGAAWLSALQGLGVPGLRLHKGPSTTPRGKDARARLIASVCYASLGRGELVAHGRKLVGLAQRRRRHGALVQCGLLRSWQPRRLLTALGVDPLDPEIAAAAVGLDSLMTDPPEDASIMDAVETALSTDPGRRPG